MKPEQQIQARIKEHREWLKSMDSRSQVEKWTDKALSLFRNDTLQDLRMASLQLDFIRWYHAVRGILALYDGDDSQESSLDIHNAIQLLYWALKIRRTALLKSGGRGPDLTIDIPAYANLACYAFVMQNDFLHDSCLQVLRLMGGETPPLFRRGEGIVSDIVWNNSHFPHFVLALFDDEQSFSDLPSPYREILSADRSENLLLQMCDYHCDNMTMRNNESKEFELPPFDLIPFEVHAASLKLFHQPVPVDHPILWFSSFQPVGQTHHPLVDAAKSSYEKLWGA